MPSPFPGMNPWLEQDTVWNGFHQLFVPAMIEALVPQIRPRYFAKLEEHVYIHTAGDEGSEHRLFIGRPDISVIDSGRSGGKIGSAVLEPPAHARLRPAHDVDRQSFVEIRDRESMELITVVELLSPSNKNAGRDREAYITKRDRLLASPVHLVEIDLLRGGARMPLDERPDSEYYVMVSRSEERPDVGIWPIHMRDALPVIPVPLKADDDDATLDLQSLLHRVYDAAGFADYIYRGKPKPALRPEDAAWAAAIQPG